MDLLISSHPFDEISMDECRDDNYGNEQFVSPPPVAIVTSATISPSETPTRRLVSLPSPRPNSHAPSSVIIPPVSPCSSCQQANHSSSPPSSPSRTNDRRGHSSAATRHPSPSRPILHSRYVLHPTLLGTGRHGMVRSCHHRLTHQLYAVKSIQKSRRTPVDLLYREISLLSQCNHPNIVQLVDWFQDQTHLHLVMESCTGGELYHGIIQRSEWNARHNIPGCFSESEAREILRQILHAVYYLHSRDVVHRDIKPENILFVSQQQQQEQHQRQQHHSQQHVDAKTENARIHHPLVKLIDFGMAKRHSPKDPPMTSRVGTPYYIAPEVLESEYSNRGYDRSCDLWSIGVIAYTLLCGYPPFNGREKEDVYQSVRRGRLYFPKEEWDGISLEAKSFIRGLLERDTRKRMTVGEALGHGWLRRGDGEEDEVPLSSVEVIYDCPSMGGDSIVCEESFDCGLDSMV